MNIKSNFLIFLILLLQFSFSNIWDNIYTQSNSPHFIIYDNFEINLLNIETNSTAGTKSVATFIMHSI